uniref:Orf1 n=1 Tax=uncultured bacterium BAC10-10 TaxID=333372 RepID=Q4JIP5_9BACT|nr:Orf1 [uncultured bacterium BAC10-10]
MRILVHEFVSGGGLVGQVVQPSLLREGRAMLTALVSDLAAIPGHRIVTTTDPRFPLIVPDAVEVVAFRASAATFRALIRSADAVWLVAPETGGCLARLSARVERSGVRLLGSTSSAIRRASDKAALPSRLARIGIAHPTTRIGAVGGPRGLLRGIARDLGYPIVVKPARGAGCDGVWLARNARELGHAVDQIRQDHGLGVAVFQRYVPGTPASVALLADGKRALALSVNGQRISRTGPFSYRGGITPLAHPLSKQAAQAAVRACESIAGLRGYVGVDLVLTRTEAVVIEVNPRLTTAYLGVRAALAGSGHNVAAMALAACRGILPRKPPVIDRSVRFTAGGRILP